MTVVTPIARPIIKFPGGKTYLLAKLTEILDQFPCALHNYDEPMVGGGAVYFALAGRFRSCRIADSNPELINLYQIIQHQVEALIAELENGSYFFVNKKQTASTANYYRIRASSPTSRIERAARIVFLLKTCFNGLMRVNKKGQFNTPQGSYESPKICDSGALRMASRALADTEIIGPEDATTHIIGITKKSFLFVDPPYHNSGGKFTDYSGVFGDKEQRELVCALLKSDCPFIYTNRATDFIISLFDGSGTTLDQVDLRHSIQPKYTTGKTELELVAYRFPHTSCQ